MSKYCPKCGEQLIDSAKFCKNCGFKLDDINQNPQTNFTPETVDLPENRHTFAIVLGYICAILIPLIGVIVAAYLLTRKDSSRASKHGKYILVIAIIVWILSIISIFH
jgi:uncharacterized membrane protein YvbJ